MGNSGENQEKSGKIREKIKYCVFLSIRLTFLPIIRPFANVPAQAIGSRFPLYPNNTIGLLQDY